MPFDITISFASQHFYPYSILWENYISSTCIVKERLWFVEFQIVFYILRVAVVLKVKPNYIWLCRKMLCTIEIFTRITLEMRCFPSNKVASIPVRLQFLMFEMLYICKNVDGTSLLDSNVFYCTGQPISPELHIPCDAYVPCHDYRKTYVPTVLFPDPLFFEQYYVLPLDLN